MRDCLHIVFARNFVIMLEQNWLNKFGEEFHIKVEEINNERYGEKTADTAENDCRYFAFFHVLIYLLCHHA